MIADFAYGFAVYGNILTSSFLAQGAIYRSAEAQMEFMPIRAAGIALAMVAAAMLLAVSNFRGIAGGLQFGLLLACSPSAPAWSSTTPPSPWARITPLG